MTTRTVAALVAAAAAAVVLVLVWAPPARAASYRYWSFWHGTAAGSWSFSPVGAGSVPAAGSVDGWRFAVSAVAGSVTPRAPASFAGICAGRTAPAGDKLVGLVVDYGTSADAPPGQHPPRGVDTYCAEVPSSYTSGQVLARYAPVTDDAGLVCSVDGYPSNECGVIVQPTRSPAPKPTRTSAGPSATRPSAHAPSSAGAGRGAGPSVSPAPGSAGSSPAATSATAPTGTPAPAVAGSSGVAAPSAVAVGAGGVPRDDGPGGPPVGAIAAGALVVLVGGAAALRSARSAHGRSGG